MAFSSPLKGLAGSRPGWKISAAAGNSALGATPNIAGGTIITTGVYLTNGTPLLAPLGHYSGPTPTMPPMPGSPAIDPVGDDTTSVFATDQRKLPRVVNGIVDLGAVAGVHNPAVTLPALIQSSYWTHKLTCVSISHDPIVIAPGGCWIT